MLMLHLSDRFIDNIEQWGNRRLDEVQMVV